MFKLVVLFALVAIAAAKPGYLHGGLAYSAVATPVVAAPVAVPAAVSHSYRTDVVSKPVIATYAAPAVVATPVIAKTVVAAPALHAVHAAPLAYAGYGYGAHGW